MKSHVISSDSISITFVEMSSTQTKVVLIGVGGATCSGKTTLAKHLRSTLPGSFIIHQDDFAPAQELIPIHPIYGVQDWDDAPGAIDWDKLAAFIARVKKEGSPPEHHSHDHLNPQLGDVPVPPELRAAWAERFQAGVDRSLKQGIRTVFALLDGFLLYWDQRLIEAIDVPIFLRVTYSTLKERRIQRSGYHTAEGSFWQDPPDYWENIVCPAYLKAHADMFAGSDVEKGEPTGKVPGLVVLDGERSDMAEVFELACRAIEEHV